ncbi:MAG: diguanylate cyclase [Sulfuricurvum sp.]|uniref:diguanylate cyclase n=1 Tax=Sulfuricurvum sp. TaxID=2025608 RepID=UPI00262A5339|nr:diguanylate cyclase [Sulfuricurvum sp.]MDD5158955.1 diguanylate cyclase [Sulfuricurvum sp.]
MHSKEIRYSFTRHYLIAIVILAILSSSAFYALKTTLKSSESTAFIVNLSGNQRMLSQRIALYSQLYYLSLLNPKNSNEHTKIRELLTKASFEMRDANEKLLSGKINDGDEHELSYEIYELYFGQKHLKNRVDDYLVLIDKLIHAKTYKEASIITTKIITSSNTLVNDLNAAGLQYQKEGNANIEKIQAMLFTIWILTIITLLLEIIFIFQPMAHKMATLFQKIVWHEHNLQEEIKIRTNKLTLANEKLAHLASHDPLTGLKNRLNMEKELQGLIDHQHVYQSSYAVVMLDIDWFKKINDTYGHDAGDFVLTELAKIFLESVRPQDSVYRAGGEEFVVIFNRITQEQAVTKCEKIRQRIQDHPFVYHELIFRITISIGIYHPQCGILNNVTDILKLADNALYQAKRTGRNKIVLAENCS